METIVAQLLFSKETSRIFGSSKLNYYQLMELAASYMYFGNSITIYEDIVIVGAYGNKDPNGQWVEQCISLQEIQMGTGHSKLNFFTR